MRRLITPIILIILLAGSFWYVFFGAARAIEQRLAQQLNTLGFKHVAIADTDAGANQTTVTKITLDAEKLDTIGSITLSRGWLNSIGGKAPDITVDSLDLYRTVDHVNDLLPSLMLFDKEKLKDLPDNKILFQNARVNMATSFGAFQYVINLSIEPYQNDKRKIQAVVKGTQDTLMFDSTWNGWIDRNGGIVLDGSIPEVKTHIGPFRLMRGNGWMSLTNEGRYPALNGQIESGAAKLGELPLQNFSLTLNARENTFTLLTRAQATGAMETAFAADITIDAAQKQIGFTLNSGNVPVFLAYLNNAMPYSTEPLQRAFNGDQTLALSIDYQLDKRFPGGPHPFDLRGTADGDTFLDGTFLIYPGTFDTRGSARINKNYLPGIAEYFDIAPEVISGEYVRLDGSLARFIAPPPASGVGAGVENNLGE